MCEAFAEGAKEAGHEVEILNVYDGPIGTYKGITACGEESSEVGEEASTSVNYVALGDSYAAMGSRSAALDEPPFCLRAAPAPCGQRRCAAVRWQEALFPPVFFLRVFSAAFRLPLPGSSVLYPYRSSRG